MISPVTRSTLVVPFTASVSMVTEVESKSGVGVSVVSVSLVKGKMAVARSSVAVSRSFTACGESFTGATWRFHNFGPWDNAVYERVEPAAGAINADIRKIESGYGDEDWIRLRCRDDYRLTQLERELPAVITSRLPREVHKFLGDTPSLLDHVYKTTPMINAAPQEVLDLSLVAKQAKKPQGDSVALKMERLSNKKKNRCR